jgi:predicted cytidylate kinase
MKITIGGKPGSGKTTMAKLIAKKLGYKHYSMGDLRGKLAQKHNMTIDQLNKIGLKEFWTDKEIDEELTKLGKKEDNIIIDTWTGFNFIPDSIKIFLDVDYKEGAKRIFKNQRPDEPKKKTIEEVENMIKQRVKDTRARYQKWYKIDFLDKSNYDIIIDTTKLTKEEVLNRILEFVKTFKY